MISLFASAIRTDLWESCLYSLLQNKIKYEVVFSGNADSKDVLPIQDKYPELNYIYTKNIKPAQCYEVARRYCKGELCMWMADDCEFSDGLLDGVYKFWKGLKNFKAVISIKTNENGTNNDLNDHRFFGFNVNTPLMAPLGVMNTVYLDCLGGLDRRYVCGQYENDIVMRIYSDGGKVHKYEDGIVKIDHLKKHGRTTKFWDGYNHDRKILEDSWVIGGYGEPPNMCIDVVTQRAFRPITNREVTFQRNDRFEGYEDYELTRKSQSFKYQWE